MKQNRHNKISWWKTAGSLILALSMLVYSGFSAVTTMECFMSGTKTVTVGSDDNCCVAEASPVASINAKCCDIQKSEVTFYSYKVEHKDFVLVPLISALVQFDRYAEPLLLAEKFFVGQFAHAPPLSGRAILTHICKYTL